LEKIFYDANHRNPKGKYGKHVYSLNDFGIDEKYIDTFTREYQLFQKELK